MSYVIYGGELSLFTRKLEAAFRFYGLDYRLEPKTPENRELIETRAATHQVPVLHTPENWMLADTTPLLALLDSRVPQRAMFPHDPDVTGGSGAASGALVHILEEFFDEWVARVMVHYRWHYPESAQFAALRMSNGNQQAAAQVAAWGPRACRATGTESPSQQRAAEEEYLRLMTAADRQLRETAFLLGNRPTALDCIVLGGLRAHTLMDPDPKAAMARFTTLIDWAERRADRWDGKGELAALPDSTPFAHTVLGEMATTYQRFTLANAEAQAAGAKACHAQVYDEAVSFLSRPYPVRSRQMVAERLRGLNPGERTEIEGLLARYDLSECFAT